MTPFCFLARPLLVVLTVAAAVSLGPRTAAALPEAATDGYLVWLHSLEASIAARNEAGTPEVRPLYPFGLLGEQAPRAGEDALAAVAAAMDELESRPRLLQEPRPLTPLHAISRARNHCRLAEYDSALVWYEEAARRDGAREWADELRREALAAAVAAGDSLRVTRLALDLVGERALTRRPVELELAYRFFLARADSANLELLVAETAAEGDLAPGRVAYWHARALAHLGRWQASLDVLCELVAAGGLSHGLDEDQRAWVLTAIPDQLVVLDRAPEADPLYRALAGSSVGEAALWARCQAAALDFLAGRFLAAGTSFEELCKAEANDLWRAYACGMATLSDEMERLRSEGEPHGAADLYQR